MQPTQKILETRQLIRSFENLHDAKLWIKGIRNYLANRKKEMPELLFLYSEELPGEQMESTISPIYPYSEYENTASVKNRILLNPDMKGALVESHSGFMWKFRTVKPRISDDLFWKKFDRSKIKTRFQEELFSEIYDLHLECDDPSIDPVNGKRKELWHKLSPSFRIFKQRVIHIEDLPHGVNPATLATISLDTLNRYIQALKTLNYETHKRW